MSVSVEAPDTMCRPGNGVLEGCSFTERLTDTDYLTDHVLKWDGLVYIVLIFFFLYLARWTYSFKLWLFNGKQLGFTLRGGFAKELTEADNKALALSFAGYMFGTGLILWGSMTDLDEGTWKNIGYVFEWQAVGIVFMELARLVNDKLVLSPRAAGQWQTGSEGFDNNVELVKKRNVAVGVAEAGSYIATALVIMASISGPPGKWWQDLISSAIWFVLGQLAFTVFVFLINTKLVTAFNLFLEIKRHNVAAGTLFALELVAVGNLVSNSILKSDSLVTFGVWFLLGGALLVVLRFVIDFVIIPSSSLNREIQVDRNVGAALLVGGIPVGLSFVVNTFLPDTCLNNT